MSSPLIHNQLNADLRTISHAEGVWLYDTDGERLLDGSSGAVVVNIGHAHPEVVRAIAEQAARVTYTHRGSFTSAPAEALAARLTEYTGYAGAWFVNSGAEANEAAMQFALQYFREIGQPERHWFLSHEFGFHGSTLGALSMSGHTRRVVLGDLALDFPRLPTPHAFLDAAGLSDAEYSARLLAGARERIAAEAHRLAAVVIEPVGGATFGATTPPDGYLQGLRALCDEYGVLLITDEVMSGMGRTGKPLAAQHWGVQADIVALGKGLGAGYTPVAATLLSRKVLTALEEGSGRILGGHTYAGNPLSLATALAVLDVSARERVDERAALRGQRLGEGLRELRERHPIVADARGIGLLQAIELVRGDDQPLGSVAAAVIAAAASRGLLIYAASGGYNDALMITPPLTITEEELEFLLEALDGALGDAEAARG